MSPRFVLAAASTFAVLFVSPALAGGGDPVNGEKLFAAKCIACHAVEPGDNKHGPNLFGIIGRKAGSVEGYKYSKALKASDIIWDLGRIDGMIQEPQHMVKGTKMRDPEVNSARERADIVSYLRTLK